MLKTRLLAAAVGIPLALAVIWLGGVTLEVFVILLALIAFLEYTNMMRVNRLRMVWPLGLGLLITLLEGFYHGWPVRLVCFGVLLVSAVLSVVQYPRYTLEEIAFSAIGGGYMGFLFGFGLWIGYQPEHFLYYILVLLLTWGNDTGGYVFGRAFGKRKLSPQLSPKKTIAGAIGGMGLATAAVLILNFFLTDGFSWLPLIGLCLLASVAAQVGDLFASLMKRYFGVKDSGRIIPGHGGILDRFDSFMLVLPVVYYFLQFAV